MAFRGTGGRDIYFHVTVYREILNHTVIHGNQKSIFKCCSMFRGHP